MPEVTQLEHVLSNGVLLAKLGKFFDSTPKTQKSRIYDEDMSAFFVCCNHLQLSKTGSKRLCHWRTCPISAEAHVFYLQENGRQWRHIDNINIWLEALANAQMPDVCDTDLSPRAKSP
jgi:hypothetical protein